MTYVQYGCGLCAPDSWLNFDASPTLFFARMPVLGKIITRSRVRFPENVKFGNVAKGLPLASHSCEAVYASHVLEHLCYSDFNRAIAETYRILKLGGRFRVVMPDLVVSARNYLDAYERGDSTASLIFMRDTYLGEEFRKPGISGLLERLFGNSRHLWLWDRHSLTSNLLDAGFSEVRAANFGDSEETAFQAVEEEDRFLSAISIEAVK